MNNVKSGLSHSIVLSTQIICSKLLSTEQKEEIYLSCLEKQHKIDKRRLCEIFTVLDACRWVDKNGSCYIFHGNTNLKFQYEKLIQELERKRNLEQNFSRMNNIDIIIHCLQALYFSKQKLKDETIAISMQKPEFTKRIFDQLSILSETKIILQEKHEFWFNQNYLNELSQKVDKKTENTRINKLTNQISPLKHQIFSQLTEKQYFEQDDECIGCLQSVLRSQTQ